MSLLHCLLLLALASSIFSRPLAIRQIEERSTASESSGEENNGLFEGDIFLVDGQWPYASDTAQAEIVKRSSETSSGDFMEMLSEGRDDLWPNGIIPYKFHGNLVTMHRENIKAAMTMWTNATGGCITFRPAKDEADCVLFEQKENECASYVGRIGGEQKVTVSLECSIGNIAHELGHVIGLWHEHSRRDRDAYIQVFENNTIEGTFQLNFGILSEEVFDRIPEVSYDIGSIMHYGPLAFSQGPNDKLKTICTKKDAPWTNCDNPEEMGQRIKISHKDVLRVKLLYGCGDVTEDELTCTNSQLPTPTPTTPSPVITTTATPTPTVTDKLLSNDIITLRVGNNKKGMFGMMCNPSPGCTAVNCHYSEIGASHCETTNNEFKIIKPDSVKKIFVGDKILLRSVYKPTMWLNCSNAQTGCIISPCTSNAVDPSNSSYTSNCEDHFFIISSRKRETGKVLSTNHEILIKSFKDDSYVDCAGKRCELIPSGECPVIPTDQPERKHLREKNNDTDDLDDCLKPQFHVAKK